MLGICTSVCPIHVDATFYYILEYLFTLGT